MPDVWLNNGSGLKPSLNINLSKFIPVLQAVICMADFVEA